MKPNRPRAWFTKAEMANVFDVSVSYFDREIRPLVDAKYVRRDGRRLVFHARSVIESWMRAHSSRDANDVGQQYGLEELLGEHG